MHASRRDNQLSGLSAARTAVGVVASRLLGWHRPLFMVVEVSHRCNLACGFCDKHDGPQLSTRDGLRLFAAGGRVAPHSCPPAVYREVIDDLVRLKRAGAPVANDYLELAHLRAWPAPKRFPTCGGGRVIGTIGPDGGVPCGRVGRSGAAPNALALGLGAAFRAVERPRDCGDCWCALTVSNNYAYRLDPRLLAGRLLDRPVGLRS